MDDKLFIFIGGLHRSGTSLTHEILRSHPKISGFHETGVPEDEGQHLQEVYKPAIAFGGMGRFGFNKKSFMDENHELATADNARKLYDAWSRYWDTSKPILIEKSPPNLVRMRFLQALYPHSKFIAVLRHPLAIAYATAKWSRMPIPVLLEHNLRVYEQFRREMPYLNALYVFRYEDFVKTPQAHISELWEWIGVEPHNFDKEVRQNVNERYFKSYREDMQNPAKRALFKSAAALRRFEKRANAFGYTVDAKQPESLLSLDWLGAQDRAVDRYSG